MMRQSVVIAATAAVALSAACAFAGAKVITRGKIEISASTPMVAVSTDPIVQKILNDDFYAAKRAPGADAKSTVTLTVTLTERPLKPGVSLEQISPGDPAVVAMLRAAGATPPSIGDTGNAQPDPYESIARMEALRPDDPSMQLREEQAFQKSVMSPGMRMLSQSGTDKWYSRALVARVSVEGQSAPFTVVAVADPGDDAHQVKKLIAEEIANAALH